MKFTTTLLAALIAPLASATSILLPLYIYPSVTANSWAPVYSAAQANPAVKFYIIVNPDSGPGAAQYPNSDYITGLSKLNSYSNVFTLGYVHTTYGSDPYGAVTNNISTYAGWASYSASNISVAGIFFDEVNATLPNYQYYSNLSSYAYSQVPSSYTPVVLNPGVKPSSTKFYNICDLLVVYECTYGAGNGCSQYQDQTTLNSRLTAGYQSQAAVLLRSYTGTAAQLNNSIAVAKKNNVGAFYATKNFNYDDVSLLGQEAAAIGQS